MFRQTRQPPSRDSKSHVDARDPIFVYVVTSALRNTTARLGLSLDPVFVAAFTGFGRAAITVGILGLIFSLSTLSRGFSTTPRPILARSGLPKTSQSRGGKTVTTSSQSPSSIALFGNRLPLPGLARTPVFMLKLACKVRFF